MYSFRMMYGRVSQSISCLGFVQVLVSRREIAGD